MAAGEQVVVVVGRVFLGVQPSDEDDPRHLLLEEQVHVVRLGDSAGGLRAKDRCETALRQSPPDHFRERGEDRVLQLRQDETDEPGPLAPQLRGAFVAQYIQGCEDGLARRLGDSGLLVQHAADRGLAHADFSCHFRKSFRHAAILRNNSPTLAAVTRGLVHRSEKAACG